MIFSNLPSDDDYNYKKLRRRNTDEWNIGIAPTNENYSLVGCWAMVFVFNMSGLPVGLRVFYPRNNWLYVSLYNPGMAFSGTTMKTYLHISKALTVIWVQNNDMWCKVVSLGENVIWEIDPVLEGNIFQTKVWWLINWQANESYLFSC